MGKIFLNGVDYSAPSAPSMSGVSGVKGAKESSYRMGQVNLTAENVGALSDNITVTEISNIFKNSFTKIS